MNNSTTTQPKKALIVDDEPDLCELVEITLTRMGLETQSAHDIVSAKSHLSSTSYDLCLTDMNLPDGNGIDLVTYIQNNHPSTPVAIITAYGNMESAVRALKSGAFDFVSKPVDLSVLRKLVTSAIKLPQQSNETSSDTTGTYNLLGNSAPMEELRRKISKLARSQAPVFIHGESGCGKELAARLIHIQGARSENAFVAVNCGAIPAELMESEFFGHRKGSFTGATTDKEGLFDAADGGTLFLDEVADLPLHMQVKLLRAIQEKSIRPVGSHHEHPVDVRILSASHQDLKTLVSQGRFREDLFYRINVIELIVPSLREHREDIPLLASHLLKKQASRAQTKSPPKLSDNALQALLNHDFPGNVRELENILERALALCENDIIHTEDLHLPHTIQPPSRSSAPSPESYAVKEAKKPVQLNLAAQEKETIIQALEQNRWNKTAAARQLGLTLRQLRYRMSRMDIE